MRRPALLLALALAGCGYQLVAPGDRAPSGPLTIGALDDLTLHGDLGAHAAHHLRRALAHRLDPDAPRLDGTIRPADDPPLGFDAHRAAAARSAGVELELHLTAPDGDPLWQSGPIRRARPWIRAPDPLADRAARRQATLAALDDALTDALARLDATGAR
ncbi:MAG: hypothetical protein R3F65_25680 [bacterium]